MSAQIVDDKGLLRLGQSDLYRYAGIADRTCRRGSRATIAATDCYEIAFCFGYSGCNCSYSALRYKFYAYFSRRVDIFEVKNELREIFDGIYVMVGRGRDERNARNRVACPGYDLVDLESRKLASLTRFGPLRYLDLYFIGVDKIFGCHAEAA